MLNEFLKYYALSVLFIFFIRALIKQSSFSSMSSVLNLFIDMFVDMYDALKLLLVPALIVGCVGVFWLISKAVSIGFSSLISHL